MTEIMGCKDKSPEIDFLMRLLMKMEAAKGVSIVSRDGEIFGSIIDDSINKEKILSEMKKIALSTERSMIELSHGFYKGQLGKFLLMDVRKNYVVVILFDNAMEANEIFSHYYQIVNFIGNTIAEILIDDKAGEYFR